MWWRLNCKAAGKRSTASSLAESATPFTSLYPTPESELQRSNISPVSSAMGPLAGNVSSHQPEEQIRDFQINDETSFPFSLSRHQSTLEPTTGSLLKETYSSNWVSERSSNEEEGQWTGAGWAVTIDLDVKKKTPDILWIILCDHNSWTVKRLHSEDLTGIGSSVTHHHGPILHMGLETAAELLPPLTWIKTTTSSTQWISALNICPSCSEI